MKHRIFALLTALLLLLPLLFTLVACGNTEDEDEEEGEEVVVPAGTLVLNVYDWGEYISDGFEGSYDTNAEFEKYYFEKTGQKVKVNYSTYATNEDMYAKLKSGAGNYDVIFPSDYMIEKMANEGMLYAFNPAETVENFQYINEDFKGLYHDPEDVYSVAYSYGMVGIIYNAAMVDEEDVADESWDLLWNEKYRSKILQFNNPRDAFATAQYLLGIDVNSNDKADWDRAFEKLLEQKELVQGYVSDEIYNKMESGSAAIGTYYAGDYITMVAENEDLAFYYPAEGTNVFVDAMCIPANAQHKQLAIEYINFMLSSDAAIANAEYIGYACPNRLVYEDETYQEYMGEDGMAILYGSEGVNDRYRDAAGNPIDPAYHDFTPEMQAYVNMLWENLKTENSIEVWIHVTAALIVIGAVTLIVTTTVMKKKRMKDYFLHTASDGAAPAKETAPVKEPASPSELAPKKEPTPDGASESAEEKTSE